MASWMQINSLLANYKLQTIISSDQTGFIQGRYIGENIRLTLDMIEYINSNKLSGLLLFVDFEKAFDKIEWSFMFECMRFF